MGSRRREEDKKIMHVCTSIVHKVPTGSVKKKL
jgi:hypothetical protein